MLNRFNHEPTTNREDECAITEGAFREGYIQPRTDIRRNGKKVAVIGAGPAGLAAANALNLKGYTVTVFEKNEAAGGLLRYGIPNFKLNKAVIDRRIAILEQEGIEFCYGCTVAIDNGQLTIDNDSADNNCQLSIINYQFDAIVIASGTPTARDLKVPGRELKGVHLALEMLSQQNRVLAGMEFSADDDVMEFGAEDSSDVSSSKGDFASQRKEMEALGINVQAGVDYCMGDDDFYLELMQQFVSEADTKIGKLRSFYDEKDFKNYEILIHAVKSNSKMIGIDNLSEDAKLLEKAAREGDIEYIDQNHARVVADYESIAGSLRGILV